MAGFASGQEAHDTFVANLKYATEKAAALGITILIEPLNPLNAPGYFLSSTALASEIITEVGASNLKLMFDCYHVQIIEGNICHRMTELLPIIGHIQFAAVPGRGAPDQGEINYPFVFSHIKDSGFTGPLGAEYLPGAPTDETLDWLPAAQAL